ncbi:MAG: YihY/virulence factor BrkB family protein [Bryobacteraceae bacterium]
MTPRFYLAKDSSFVRFWNLIRPTMHYWMETEVHVYGFSIAANVLLSFFPFMVVMASFCRYVLHWRGAEQAIYLALSDYLPGNAQFLSRNLEAALRPIAWPSMIMLLFTANGVFEPLEVAFNRVWGVKTNRSFFRNQLLSMGLIFACGSLILLSTVLTAWNQELWSSLFPPASYMSGVLTRGIFKLAAAPIIIIILLLVYGRLPNCRIPLRQILPTAIFVGGALEVLKYINLLTWPWFGAKLQREYGPFINSVSIILWSFFASMIVLAGAEWAARHTLAVPEAKTEEECPPVSST